MGIFLGGIGRVSIRYLGYRVLGYLLLVGCIGTSGLVSSYRAGLFLGKLTKSGIPGWFLNKIGYLFFRDGARLRNLPVVCGIFRVGLR